MARVEVHVPDIGDAGEVEVIELVVAPGDQVAVDDPLIVIESDKASMEVPATIAGAVQSLALAVGDRCAAGDVIAVLEVVQDAADGKADTQDAGSVPAQETAQDAAPAQADNRPAAASAAPAQADNRPAASAQDTAQDAAPAQADNRPAAASAAPAQADNRDAAASAGDKADTQDAPAPAPESAPASAGDQADTQDAPASPSAHIYAGPAVRKLARELGAPLAQVTGSGAAGRILKEDLYGFVKQALTDAAGAPGTAPGAAAGAIPPLPTVDFARFGAIRLEPLTRTRKAGAANLHRSWLNLPHVTQFDDADITELETFRKTLQPEAEQAGIKLTLLPFLMKIAAAALREFPRLGGSLAGDGEHYVFKDYCHLGFAVDTPEGLLVPVVRDADRKGVFELAREIAQLSEQARSRKLPPTALQGGCFSLSSLGAFGGRGFTPIVNAPEVAILGVARLTRQPVWDGQTFVPRTLLPLCLSYDHRAVNGAEAGRFLTWYVQTLADPRRLLLY